VTQAARHGTVSGNGTLFTYVPADGFLGSDSFSYRAWDSVAFSAETEVSLEVVVAPPLSDETTISSVEVLADRKIRVDVQTLATRTWLLLVSTNLTDWNTLPAESPKTGPGHVVDTNAPAYSTRFYRVAPVLQR
jgi:hypothetical protein